MHVAFEGLIGSGKTVVATSVANELGSDTILALERYESNPFFRHFYIDHARWGLQIQLAFLLERLATLGPLSSAPKNVIADYSFLKGMVFARVVLNEAELALYSAISQQLAPKYTQPDMIVYLEAPSDVLLDRIYSRGRPYEKSIDRQYLEALRQSYEEELALLPKNRLLRLDATVVDPDDRMQMLALGHRVLHTPGLD